MKKQFKILFLTLTIVSIFALTSCGDEEPDPQPKPEEKTELEKVKEAIAGSTWELASAEIVAEGQTFVYIGASCDFSAFAVLGSQGNITATNANDLKFVFEEATMSYWGQGECANQSATDVKYSVTEESGAFIFAYKHGQSPVSFEILTPVDELKGKEVILKSLSLRGAATATTLKFKRS